MEDEGRQARGGTTGTTGKTADRDEEDPNGDNDRMTTRTVTMMKKGPRDGTTGKNVDRDEKDPMTGRQRHQGWGDNDEKKKAQGTSTTSLGL